jgi:methylated-DNA-[protein]-cysteine S-methyltransferase
MEQPRKAIILSPAGLLEIVSEDGFITAVNFREEGEETVDLARLPSVLRKCIDELKAYFAGELRSFSIPLKQQGSEFQQRVWNELLNIPFGKTISYLDLARRLGDPKVIRAAGTANGRNQLAIIVPCHRVIGSDGSLTGYAGGLGRKQWLLEHEQKIFNGVQKLF